jgi:hypothetical protein
MILFSRLHETFPAPSAADQSGLGGITSSIPTAKRSGLGRTAWLASKITRQEALEP